MIDGTGARRLQNNLLLTKTQKGFTGFINIDCPCFEPTQSQWTEMSLGIGKSKSICPPMHSSNTLLVFINFDHTQPSCGSYCWGDGAEDICLQEWSSAPGAEKLLEVLSSWNCPQWLSIWFTHIFFWLQVAPNNLYTSLLVFYRNFFTSKWLQQSYQPFYLLSFKLVCQLLQGIYRYQCNWKALTI